MSFIVTTFGTNRKPVCYFLGYCISPTVSKISRNICQIFAVDRGRLSLTHSFAVNT